MTSSSQRLAREPALAHSTRSASEGLGLVADEASSKALTFARHWVIQPLVNDTGVPYP